MISSDTLSLCPHTNSTLIEQRPIFLSSYAVSDISLIDSLCQKVYSVLEVASPGTVASMHGIFFFVMKDLIAMKDPLCQRFNLSDYLEPCERAMIKAIESYEVLAVPSFENILALAMGVSISNVQNRTEDHTELTRPQR